MSESLADVVHEAVRKASLVEFLLARVSEDEAALAAQEYEDCDNPAHWANARLLAECKAKREIVGLHEDGHDDGDPRSWEWPYVGCATLRAVALPYSEHPDYDPSWSL